MFYDNFYNVDKNMTYKKQKITKFAGINSDIDSNILSISNSPMTYNFDYSDGALRDGMGVKALQFCCAEGTVEKYKLIDSPSDMSFIKGCWLFNTWSTEQSVYCPYLIIYSSNGDFYYNILHGASSEIVKMNNLNFTERPIVTSYKLNGVDTLILVSEKDGMFTWQYPGVVKQIENVPSISSMCVHENRLFVTNHGEKRTIMYSDNLDPTNFSVSIGNGGVIDLPDEFGKSNKVLSFEGYVYVFRDFNISKVTTYLDEKDFTLSQLYVSNGRIFDKTVCICGNKIVYLASDGIYMFNGSSATKMDLSINKLFEGVDNSKAVAGYSNGYYYLSCNIVYGDDVNIGNESPLRNYTNNAFIKINIDTGAINILRGYDIEHISVINDIYKSEVCVVIKESDGGYSMGVIDNSGMYFDTPTTKFWKSPTSDFGNPNKDKIIKEISLESSKNITLCIASDKESREIEVVGKSGYQIVRPYVKGSKISITFKSIEADNYISNPQITVGYL